MTFYVWHKTVPTFMDNSAAELENFPVGFTLVAAIETSDPDKAYELSNHIDHDWTTNPEVAELFAVNLRSTSVGDVLSVQDKSTAYSVASCGFTEFEIGDVTK